MAKTKAEPKERKPPERDPVLASFKRKARIEFDLMNIGKRRLKITGEYNVAIDRLSEEETELREELARIQSELTQQPLFDGQV